MEKICVLLSTYNGEKYLRDQLDSILQQENVDLKLIIRDDLSRDNTIGILEEYKGKFADTIIIPEVLSGYHEERGIGSSYFSLLEYAVNNYKEIEYFAFSDQDDIWKLNKLHRAINEIEKSEYEKVLYFSEKEIVDEHMNEICSDRIYFENNVCDYLIPNEASGCTMVINRKYAEFILRGRVQDYPYIHDVLVFKLAVCTDVHIICDRFKSMKYRQHTNNAEGHKRELVFSKKNVKKVFEKRKHFLSKLAKDLLSDYCVNKEAEYVLGIIARIGKVDNKVKAILFLCRNSHRPVEYKVRFGMSVLLNGI